jgi:hypothetical protein
MSETSSLQITTVLQGDSWIITANVLPESFLPAEIFIYENTGTSELGTYQAVCSKEELLRLQIWSGTPIVKFGNKYVRYGQAKIIIDATTNNAQVPQTVVDHLILTTKLLSQALQTAASTTQVVIV